MVDDSHWSTLGNLSFNAGWRVLPFREAVNAVVEHNDVEIYVAA